MNTRKNEGKDQITVAGRWWGGSLSLDGRHSSRQGENQNGHQNFRDCRHLGRDLPPLRKRPEQTDKPEISLSLLWAEQRGGGERSAGGNVLRIDFLLYSYHGAKDRVLTRHRSLKKVQEATNPARRCCGPHVLSLPQTNRVKPRVARVYWRQLGRPTCSHITTDPQKNELNKNRKVLDWK